VTAEEAGPAHLAVLPKYYSLEHSNTPFRHFILSDAFAVNMRIRKTILDDS